MSLKTKLAATAAAAVALCSVSQAYALTPDQYALVDVRMLITTTCGFANASPTDQATGAGSGTNQGVMDFNTQVAGYNVSAGLLNQPRLDRQALGIANKAPLAAVCAASSNGAFVTVSALNAALATGGAGDGKSVMAQGTNYVDYTVTTDQGGNNLIKFDTDNDNFAATIAPTDNGLVATIPANGLATVIPIWGHVTSIPAASPAGEYHDTLRVNLFIL
jgi:hypothetical protein